MLEAVLLEQVEDYIGPFDLDIDGFDESWWTPPVGRVGSSHHDWLSFILDGREVARAESDYEAQLGGDYQGPPLPRRIIDIDFLEVRSDRRGEGIGKQAVELIKARYPGKVITAFSEEADEFWAAVGWRRYPRTDGSTHHRPLFVWDARQQQL